MSTKDPKNTSPTSASKKEEEVPEFSIEEKEANFELIVKNLTKGVYTNAYLKLIHNSVFSGPLFKEYARFIQMNTTYHHLKRLIYDACYQTESVYTGRKEKPERFRIFSLPFMKDLQIQIGFGYIKTFFGFFERISSLDPKDKYVYSNRGELNSTNLDKFNEDEDLAIYSVVNQLIKDFPVNLATYKHAYQFIQDFAKRIPLGSWLTFETIPSKDNEVHLRKVIEKYNDLWRWRNHKGFFIDSWIYQYSQIKERSHETFDYLKFNYFNKSINMYYTVCSENNIHCLKTLIDFFNSDEFSDENLNRTYELISKGYATKKVSEKQEVENQWRSMLDVVLLIASDYHEVIQKSPIDRTPNEKTFSDYYLKSNITKVIERVSIFRRDVLKVVG